MRPYFSYFKLRLIMGMQYRAAAIAGICTQFFWGLIFLMVFSAFYSATNNPQSMTFDELSTYIWLGQAFFALLYIAIKDGDIFEMIRNGNVSYELCRPINLYFFWYIKAIANRIAAMVIRFWPTIIVAAFLPAPYNLGAPASILSFVLFIVTLFLALLLICAITNLIHISTFYTLNQMGVVSILFIISDFFSGGLVPIPFMPNILKIISYVLPFRLTYDLPLRTYIGNIGVGEAIISVGVQIIWIVFLLWLGSFLMKKITKKIVIQGG